MDLAWCPVCDKQTLAVEYLYCSEACRKKDASSIIDEKISYEFPRCSRKSRKQYQSPYNSLESSPVTSPKIYPSYYTTMLTDNFSFKSISYSKPYIMSSSPSDLLLYGMIPFPSVANQNDFLIIHQIRQR
jgi:hypothetical protein